MCPKFLTILTIFADRYLSKIIAHCCTYTKFFLLSVRAWKIPNTHALAGTWGSSARVSLEFHANLLLNNLDPSTFSTQLALPPPPPSQQQSSQHLSLQSHVPMSSTPQSLPSTSTSASDLRTPHFSQSLVTPSSTTLTPVQLGSAIPLAVTGPSGLPMAAHLSHPHHGLPTSFSVPPTLTYPAGAATAVPLGAGSLILAYDSATGAASFSCFDPRSNLATKIKGGYMLASVAKGGNKFSPY